MVPIVKCYEFVVVVDQRRQKINIKEGIEHKSSLLLLHGIVGKGNIDVLPKKVSVTQKIILMALKCQCHHGMVMVHFHHL